MFKKIKLAFKWMFQHGILDPWKFQPKREKWWHPWRDALAFLCLIGIFEAFILFIGLIAALIEYAFQV